MPLSVGNSCFPPGFHSRPPQTYGLPAPFQRNTLSAKNLQAFNAYQTHLYPDMYTDMRQQGKPSNLNISNHFLRTSKSTMSCFIAYFCLPCRQPGTLFFLPETIIFTSETIIFAFIRHPKVLVQYPSFNSAGLIGVLSTL